MYRTLFLGALLGALLLSACGPNAGVTGNNNTTQLFCTGDEDGDTICDEHEGRQQNIDTDGDGAPDYRDLDSDGDGISDQVERGNVGAEDNAPIDSDGDGIADFRDTDSDNNGIGDSDDGIDDLDGDGIGNYADLDDDNDGIPDDIEIGGFPMAPADSDGDGTPDHQDLDSDGDNILDGHEGQLDSDGDTVPDYLDLDSDNDGIPDIVEAGDDDMFTIPVDTDDDGFPDFRDADSDNDGLGDAAEDLNGNGVVDPGESDPRSDDTDGDGVSDLIEVGAGTDPTDPNDNPQANGDFVFVVPYNETANPAVDTLDFATDLAKADLYFLVDVSGSMSGIMANLKNNMQTTISQAVNQIPDLQVGIGSFLYADCNNFKTYHHRLDIQGNPQTAQNTFPDYDVVYEGGCCCSEAPRSAMYFAATGHGSIEASQNGVVTPSGVPNESSAADAPGACPSGYSGYPCFRPGALPIIAVVTDERFDQYTGTSQQDAINALAGISAKTIGVYGVGSWGFDGRDAMMAFMAAQGSVDANNNPLVYDGSGAGASQAIVDAIMALSEVPLDISSLAQDNDDGTDSFGQTDTIDAVAEFIDHLEATEIGANCSTGWTIVDGNDPDTFPDTFLQVTPGNRVCWDIHVKDNTTVPATEHPQVFTATIYVYGDGVTEVDSRTVFFLVPPEIRGPGGPG